MTTTTNNSTFPAPNPGVARVADVLARMLEDLGVQHVFGIIGGACAPLADAFGKSNLRFLHTRHEGGAAFAAAEASLATGLPTVVLTTTGPGMLNALNGLAAARWDGAKVACFSAVTAAAHQGRWPVQETSVLTIPHDAFFAKGPFFDHGALLRDSVDLVDLRRRLELGFARPQGFVAQVGVSTALQSQPYSGPLPQYSLGLARQSVSKEHLEAVASILDDGPLCIWVGYGARAASRSIRALAERTGAMVLCTPRAKGVFPEEHPLFAGVTGAGGHDAAARAIEQLRPRHTLVLGTRLGEASTFWDNRLVPDDGFVHVDVDAAVFGASYPEARTIGVEAEIGAFVDALLPLVPMKSPELWPTVPCPFPEPLEPRAGLPVRASVLMDALQRVVVDGSDAVVMTESGNAFGFGNHHLRFSDPGRYRSSAAWGSMGHMVCGVVGVAVATGKRAVAVVGDGAMLMNNEINTAVDAHARAIWVVLNDAGFGIVRDGMTLSRLTPFASRIPRVDFVAFARSMGADGVRVDDEEALPAALEQALQADGPFVVDVIMDETCISPAIAGRVASLEAQYRNRRRSER
ncbi:MAG: thiamine pyrophosphate-binding protein [Deltaproteobacteria bacterium]|nr:thiamine pyrophosphate-binding protein [Deltaproteobacteria bacterium]